jgi:transcriptional regulator with XRE-family HTH domain
MNQERKAFGRRIQRLREGAGLTQAALADRLGTPLETWKNYEQGKRDLPIGLITKLAGHLNVSADVLLDITAELAEPTTPRMGRPRKKAIPQSE